MHLREGYENRDTEPSGNVIPMCVEGQLGLDVATGSGEYTLRTDTDEWTWTVSHDDLSEIGLHAVGFATEDGTDLTLVGTNGGVTETLIDAHVDLGCEQPDVLPFTGPSDLLLPLALGLVAVGTALVRLAAARPV